MSVNPQKVAEHFVYTRTTNPINGEITGWRPDPSLRCQEVLLQAGPGVGNARFAYIAGSGASLAIEDVAALYPPDTQVRVMLYPYDSSTGEDTPAEDTGLIVFEGVLERMPLRVAAQGQRERETADFVAVALPWIDNRSAEHLITGRWMYFTSGSAWDRVESPHVPAAFNYRGRANMDNQSGHTNTAAGVVEGVTLTARPFTHDDDPAGSYWTVREALRSILVQWLYGEGENTRNRMTGVETATLEALETGTSTDPRFTGLNDVLPETDVSGMRLFEAIDAVCKAAGFEFAISPSMQASDADMGASATTSDDRRYLLRLWRRHAGPAKDLHLYKRGQFPDSADETLKNVNVQRIHAMRDTAGIVNHVFARGRVLIEAGVTLKPLWKLADVDTATATDSHQQPAGLISDDYHTRHVQGGASFGTYGHVGRRWGIDCTGAASAAGLFYTSGDYQHPTTGFDWLDFLGIDGEDELTDERTERNLDAETDPIVWSKRVRRALPLRRADTIDTGKRYVLEVSENGGSSWTDITALVSFTTLGDFFGITINSVPNLAAVNAATIATDTLPAIADSWWQKLVDGDLFFRLHCLIEADHAALYRADQQATSGTAYSRGELVDLDIDEVWSHSSSVFNTTAPPVWQKITSSPGGPADASDALEGYAERYRDAKEGIRWSVSCDHFLLQPWRFQLGDRVRGIAERGLSFATNVGQEERHPSIVEMRLTLSGPNGEGSAQGMQLSLNDNKQRRGV